MRFNGFLSEKYIISSFLGKLGGSFLPFGVDSPSILKLGQVNLGSRPYKTPIADYLS